MAEDTSNLVECNKPNQNWHRFSSFASPFPSCSSAVVGLDGTAAEMINNQEEAERHLCIDTANMSSKPVHIYASHK